MSVATPIAPNLTRPLNILWIVKYWCKWLLPVVLDYYWIHFLCNMKKVKETTTKYFSFNSTIGCGNGELDAIAYVYVEQIFISVKYKWDSLDCV